jgi:hypothetical protein
MPTKKLKKKAASSDDNSSFSNNYKRSNREKKPNYIEDLGYIDKEIMKASKNPALIDVYKKCEKTLQKIKKHPLAELFNNPHENVPSLNAIEKKIKNYFFNSYYTFSIEIRKIWSYYFTNYANNPDIYQKTLKMSEYCENVMKEVEANNDNSSEAYQELSKKVAKLTKDINTIKTTPTVPNNAPLKKIEKLPISEKPMSPDEKTQLGNNIRNLNPDQLKGIVNILADSLVVDKNKKFFEFDIETLSIRKLRELDKYVKSCMRKQDPKTKPITENEKIEKLKVKYFNLSLILLLKLNQNRLKCHRR